MYRGDKACCEEEVEDEMVGDFSPPAKEDWYGKEGEMRCLALDEVRDASPPEFVRECEVYWDLPSPPLPSP